MSGLDNYVTIKLDKERHLRLTLKGMLEFEEITGRKFLKGFKLKDLGLKDTAVMLWACLIHEDKILKYDDVLCMVDFTNLETILDALAACLTQSLPKATEVKAGGRPLAEKPQTG